MKFSKVILLLFLTIFSARQAAFSQEDDTVGINAIVEKAVKLSESQPVEKVYLHFDKPFYALGDTIWFKAYLTSSLNLPSQLSKVVYVDMIGNGDSLLQTLCLPVKNSVAMGNFVLAPLSYHEGNYRVRAYTTWMYNFGESSFFTKTIPIGNGLNKQVATHAVLRGDSTSKGASLNARVVYKDENGKPLAGRRVNWQIMSGTETLIKGRGVTDQQGVLVVSSAVPGQKPLSAGTLQTDIAVSNEKLVGSTFPLRSAFNKPDIQFFPEGGRMMRGVPSKMAFKAIRTDGMGIGAKGTVVDGEGNTVCSFESQHLGMGAFIFTPETDKTYKANVTFADGSKGVFDLPRAWISSMGISANNTDTANVALRLMASEGFLEKNQGSTFYIIARSAGIICYAAQFRLQNQVYSVNVPKDKFPTGIAEFTLLSAQGRPLSERIVFIKHQNTPLVSLKSDRPSYASRQKVKLTVAGQYPDNPVPGSYSVAVVDETKVPSDEDAETTILSSLLLSSELKGYIEKPNYYFNHPDDKKTADLDLLMLTQGYRAFSYRDLLREKIQPAYYMPEQGIDVSGTLRSRSGMPVNKGNVQFIIPGRNISVSTQTDAEGRFRFTSLVFPDSSKVILSARNNPNSQGLVLTIDGNAFPAVTPNVNAADEMLNIDSTMNAYLQNTKRQYRSSIVLSEVVIKSTRPVARPSHADYPALSGLSMMPDHLIPGDRFKGCPVLLNCLQTGAMGLIYAEENFYVNRDYNAGSRVPVQVFLNGMPVDAVQLNTVNSAEVESVEIFLKDDLGTVNRTYNTNGVLVVNLKKAPQGEKMSLAQLQEMLPKSNLIEYTPLGYQKAKEFYSPKYAVQKSGPIVNDLRTTIYWNPAVLTDAAGTASVEYYNADAKGVYRAIVEGFDASGNIFRNMYRYTVK